MRGATPEKWSAIIREIGDRLSEQLKPPLAPNDAAQLLYYIDKSDFVKPEGLMFELINFIVDRKDLTQCLTGTSLHRSG